MTAASLLALAVLLAGCSASAEPESDPTSTASKTSADDEESQPEEVSFPAPAPAETTVGSPFAATALVGLDHYTMAKVTVTEVSRMSAEEQAEWPELAGGTAWTVRVSATNLGEDTEVETGGIVPSVSLFDADQQRSVPSGYNGSIAPAGCSLIPADTPWPAGGEVEGCMVHLMPASTTPFDVVYFSFSGNDEAGDPTYATVVMPLG